MSFSQKKTPKQVQTKNYPQLEDTNEYNVDQKFETLPTREGAVAVTDYTVTADLQDLEEQIKSMMEVSEHMDKYNNGRAWICKVCGKEGKLGQIKIHIESNHITGVSHTCNICGKTSRSRNALGMHKPIYYKK